MNTVNNGIPFVPENTIDPAAGLNLSLNTIDALLQILVVTMGENTPPASPANGARYVVGTSPTGAWAGQANKLARRLDSAWQFFDARHVINAGDGRMYVRPGALWVAYGGSDAGWTAGTGTPSKGSYDASTATAAQTAARLLAIESALFSVGILKA